MMVHHRGTRGVTMTGWSCMFFSQANIWFWSSSICDCCQISLYRPSKWSLSWTRTKPLTSSFGTIVKCIWGGMHSFTSLEGVGALTMTIIGGVEIIVGDMLHSGGDSRTAMLVRVCERVVALFLVSIPPHCCSSQKVKRFRGTRFLEIPPHRHSHCSYQGIEELAGARWWCESTAAVVHNGWSKSFPNAEGVPIKDTSTLKSARFQWDFTIFLRMRTLLSVTHTLFIDPYAWMIVFPLQRFARAIVVSSGYFIGALSVAFGAMQLFTGASIIQL